MTKRSTLQLNIYPKHDDKARLAFKKEGLLYRIENLLNARAFVANMAQLDKAIQTGARQYCHYVLNATRGKSWVLGAVHEPGTVSLELWQHGREGESAASVFSWGGGVDDFSMTIRRLSMMYGITGIFGFGFNTK